MFIKTSAALVAALLMSGAAFAGTVKAQMLNKGSAGTMLVDPAFLQIAPGDTVKFVAADKGHDAESIKDMIPEDTGASIWVMTNNGSVPGP